MGRLLDSLHQCPRFNAHSMLLSPQTPPRLGLTLPLIIFLISKAVFRAERINLLLWDFTVPVSEYLPNGGVFNGRYMYLRTCFR